MTGLLEAMGWAVVPVAIWLPVCVLLETLVPRTRYSLRHRFPGAFYVMLLPAALVLVAKPLRLLWDTIGLGPLFSVAHLPPVIQFIFLLILFDFLRYWEHRFEHRFWWPVHAVHHAPTELHAANAYAHPLQGVPEFFLVSVPFSLVGGVGLEMMAILAVAVAFQNLAIHSPIRLHMGRFRLLCVDSPFHRIHHSVEPRHWNRNFGLVFSFWDRLFGTAYMPGKDEWPETGVPGVTPTLRLGGYLAQPFRLIGRSTADRRRASPQQGRILAAQCNDTDDRSSGPPRLRTEKGDGPAARQ